MSKPANQAIIDELHNSVISPQDQAVLDEWQKELDESRKHIVSSEKRAHVIDMASGVVMTQAEVEEVRQNGPVEHTFTRR